MKKIGVAVLVIGGITAFALLGSGDSGTQGRYDDSRYYGSSEYSEDLTIDRYDAIDAHWDEIRDYLNGTETIDACSSQSGNCYSLDADITSGQVDIVYFENGGYLYFGAYIDENGYASEYDQDGDEWNFSLDMDSSIVDDAVYDWASDNGYEIE